MVEIWKDIAGYEGLYQVSNLGNVKSFRGSAKFGKPNEMLLKPSVINSGYYVVTLYADGKKKGSIRSIDWLLKPLSRILTSIHV